MTLATATANLVKAVENLNQIADTLVPLNPADAVDELGALKAQIATLKDREDELKAKIVGYAHANAVVSIDGSSYRAAVSEKSRETRDDALKAKIEELVAENLSHQFVTAHTSLSEWSEVRISARKSGAR